MKPGYKTTEFFMALAAFVGGVYLLTHGYKEIGERLIWLSVGTYSVSRGLAKMGSGLNGKKPEG